MTITDEQLQNAIDRAYTLDNVGDATVLEDMRKTLKKWGSLTAGQENYASNLMQKNSQEVIDAINKSKEGHADKWNNDEDYRNWVLFLAKFFLVSRQSAYYIHICNRKLHAKKILLADNDGEVPNPDDCLRLTSSKLAPRLRETYDHPHMYSLGELVQRRKSELTWHEERAGLADEMGIIVELRSKFVSQVATYSKTRGGTRTYKIMFPSGETILEERQIKLVSRKKRAHNK